MSSLELYMIPNYPEPPYIPFFLTIAIIAMFTCIQMKIHQIYTGEIDRYTNALEERYDILCSRMEEFEILVQKDKEDITQLYGYTLSLDGRVEALQTTTDENVEPRLVLLEVATKDLASTDRAHTDLLKEYGEEISLTAESAYIAAEAASTDSPAQARRAIMGVKYLSMADPELSVMTKHLDETIMSFLRDSPEKTAQEIVSQLTRFPPRSRSVTSSPTSQSVNCRLYSLLAQGRLKKAKGPRFVWSLV